MGFGLGCDKAGLWWGAGIGGGLRQDCGRTRVISERLKADIHRPMLAAATRSQFRTLEVDQTAPKSGRDIKCRVRPSKGVESGYYCPFCSAPQGFPSNDGRLSVWLGEKPSTQIDRYDSCRTLRLAPDDRRRVTLDSGVAHQFALSPRFEGGRRSGVDHYKKIENT